jgi:hypothetical protein
MSMKNSNDTIGNRTRDLPTCSALSQPTETPRAPVYVIRSTNARVLGCLSHAAYHQHVSVAVAGGCLIGFDKLHSWYSCKIPWSWWRRRWKERVTINSLYTRACKSNYNIILFLVVFSSCGRMRQNPPVYRSHCCSHSERRKNLRRSWFICRPCA